MDVDAMKPGVDFSQQLDTQVAQCRVLLAVIGPKWLDARDKTGARRLESDKDYVRIELASALKRDIAVIPVLVDGAAMPTEENLPDDLKALAFRHALEVRHTRFRADAAAIAQALGATVSPRRSMALMIGAGVAAVVVIAAGAVLWQKFKAKPAVVPPAVVATAPALAPTPAPPPAASLPAVPQPMAPAATPLPTGQSVAAALGSAIPSGFPSDLKFGQSMPDIAFRGSILLYEKISPDPALCQAACRANAQCASWTYTRPRDPDPQGGCSLKAVVLAGSPDPCCTSAIERAPPPEMLKPPQIPVGMTGVIPGAELEGGTYRYFGGSDATPEACQTACRADTQCMAWNYVRPGIYGADARCFLKNKAPMQVSSPCCIAGFEQHTAAGPAPASSAPAAASAPMLNTNLIGSDYRKLEDDNYSQCQSACKADTECLSWTFVHPGVQGPNARCYLKNKIPQSSASSCCVSGIERPAAK